MTLKQKKRAHELERILAALSPGQKVLEVGGETGFQAALLTERGFQIISIDLEQALDRGLYYPVQAYNGRVVPCADASMDAVFSSHVLEHVEELPAFLEELKRVLKPGGLGVHVMPSSVWRFWTSFSHFPYVLLRLLGLRRPLSGTANYSAGDTVRRQGLATSVRRALLSGPHGISSNEWIELWRFSAASWRSTFQRAGFEVVSLDGNGIFYSGYELFPWLGLGVRRRLASWLGSASHLVVTRKPR